MSEHYLQMNLFEPATTATVEVTELYGPEPGGIFDFFANKTWEPTTIETCWGDIRVMCDALEDYANILESVIKEWGLKNGMAYMYELHAARCRKISRKYAAAIGYDYQEAIEKCRKKRGKWEEQGDDDVGEEAMALLVKRGYKKAAPGKQTAPTTQPASEHGDGRFPGQLSFPTSKGGGADG